MRLSRRAEAWGMASTAIVAALTIHIGTQPRQTVYERFSSWCSSVNGETDVTIAGKHLMLLCIRDGHTIHSRIVTRRN